VSSAWIYTSSVFPLENRKCLFAVSHKGKKYLCLGHYDGRSFRCSDQEVQGRVYAFCYAPEIPPKKGGAS
jgi:hypothetical protein